MLAAPFARRSESRCSSLDFGWEAAQPEACERAKLRRAGAIELTVLGDRDPEEAEWGLEDEEDDFLCEENVSLVSGGATGSLSGPRVTTLPLKEDYRLGTTVLGTGASGQVRAAVCNRTGRRVAVKTFNRLRMSKSQWDEARKEAQIYSSLDHPNIAQLLKIHDEQDALHIVMECLEGGEAFDRLVAKKRYTEAEAADIMQQVLLAVSYMHAHGIVHRDLKLENLLYDRKDSSHVKVIDFGFAQSCKKEGLMQECGTLQYMAPEVLAGPYGQKADMWSIGVMLYMLLLGRHLYEASGTEALKAKAKAGRFEWPGSFGRLSEGAQSFLKGLLERDPSKRLDAGEALRHPWLSAHSGGSGGQCEVDRHAVQKLWSFVNKRRREKVALLMRAWSLRNEDQVALRKEFHALDEDGDGFLTPKDLSSVLGSESDEKAELLFASLDINGDGKVTWSEFLAAAMVPPRHVKRALKPAAPQSAGSRWRGHLTSMARAAQAAFTGPSAWDFIM